MTILHRTVVRGVNGAITNDFGTVYLAATRFLRGEPVYVENLETVDPHYLYAPSATLLLSPFGMIDTYNVARWLFIGLNVAAIVFGVIILVKLFSLNLSSAALPITLLLAFSTESVTNTLVFTNINGVIFACEVGFLYLLHHRRLWWAGVPMGISLAIKPLLLPLLLLPLIKKQWQPFVLAGAIPFTLLAVAYPLAADPRAFVSVTIPYLGTVRDYYNSSIAGIGAYYGAPDPLVLGIRILATVLGLATIYVLARYRYSNELLWLTTTSGVILTTTFLVGSLGQMYYSLMLLPLALTVVLRGSLVRSWPAWLAFYAFYSPDNWESVRWLSYGRTAEFLLPTLGWLLILCVVLVSALAQQKHGKRQSQQTANIEV